MKKTKITVLAILAILCLTIFPAEAQAKTVAYSVSYNANGGKQAPKKQIKRSAKKKVVIRLSKKRPVRKGFIFQKWNTKKTGKGKSYKPGAKVTLKRGSRKLYLYAMWKKVSSTSGTQKALEAKRVPAVNTGEDSTGGSAKPTSLEVHFIDVGQGDATLIICDGEAMLIDAGENDKGTAIQKYLMTKDVKTLKYVIGTHPHSDHIGGLDVVITKFNVGTLFMPAITADTRTYDDVIQAAKYKSLKITNPTSGTTYGLGSATFQIVSTGKTYTDNLNNDSICIRLTHGSNSFLFVGDAEEEEELDMVNAGYTLKSDVYKAAHHGSRTGSVERFMNAVTPTYAVISCGEGNEYGHPHAAVLNTLRQMGVKTFRTDEQGTIVCTSDGKSLKWNMSPSTSWISGEPTGSLGSASSVTKPATPSGQYVLNKNTHVFHLPTCASVSSMSEKNRQDVNNTRESLISQGYKPCGNCNP